MQGLVTIADMKVNLNFQRFLRIRFLGTFLLRIVFGTTSHRRARRNLRSLGIRKILPQTRKLTDTKNIPQIDALITFTEKDLRSLLRVTRWS